MAELIEKILEYQIGQERSDAWMGKKIGVCKQRWQQIRKNPKSASGIVSPILRGLLNSKLATEKEIIDFIRGTNNAK